ncbi:MAG: trypsin-like peptidase domain-containing protein, partial [Dehalococcoidia bacterium]|nr:trypsin-like peptidase domain-containing protein [Dehalococcoidia bacterium]
MILALREKVVRVIGSDNQGSGALIDEGGLLATNWTVVGDDPSVLVELADGTKRVGIVAWVDRVFDLALVSISGGGYPSLPIRDPESLEIGDDVMILGFPVRGSVTENAGKVEIPPFQPFITGLGQEIRYISTDIELLPGSEGGPLVDTKGRLVGIGFFDDISISVGRLLEVIPTLGEGGIAAATVEEEILYSARGIIFSLPSLFATDEDGNGEKLLPRQGDSNSGVERSPDGTKLVYVSPRGLVSNLDIYISNADGSAESRLTFNGAADIYPSWGPRSEKLVFVSNRDENNEIYIMNADGTGETRLTNNDASDDAPHISPDGTMIAFNSDRDGNNEIYIMDIDGGNVRRLTNSESMEERPRWSPDGQRIVFDSDASGNLDVYAMDADGTNMVRLTDSTDGELFADWSPDGAKIVYGAALQSGALELFVMNADGSGQRQITESGGVKFYPRWARSPFLSMPSVASNTSIAFVSDRAGETDIYRMESSGNQVYRLTDDQARDEAPVWSPDGKLIAFQSFREGNGEIYVMDAGGLGQKNLTAHAAEDGSPAWSPDGTLIAFETNRNGNDEVYVMNPDGTGLVDLSNYPGRDFNPSW